MISLRDKAFEGDGRELGIFIYNLPIEQLFIYFKKIIICTTLYSNVY